MEYHPCGEFFASGSQDTDLKVGLHNAFVVVNKANFCRYGMFVAKGAYKHIEVILGLSL